MPKPIFVLLHGAWHTPACYNPIKSFLSTHGYTSICPSLPSVAFAPPPNPLEEDIKIIRSTVLDLVAENDVVVVMRSYSGIPGGSALEGLDKESCKGRRIKGGVIRLVYVMAWMVDEGYVYSAGRKTDNTSGAIVVDGEVCNSSAILSGRYEYLLPSHRPAQWPSHPQQPNPSSTKTSPSPRPPTGLPCSSHKASQSSEARLATRRGDTYLQRTCSARMISLR